MAKAPSKAQTQGRRAAAGRAPPLSLCPFSFGATAGCGAALTSLIDIPLAVPTIVRAAAAR